MLFVGADRGEQQRVGLSGNDLLQSGITCHASFSRLSTDNNPLLQRDDAVKAGFSGSHEGLRFLGGESFFFPRRAAA